MGNVYQSIAEKIPEMSKAQKKIGEYILQNPNHVPFLTVGKLAQITSVSEATVVRFATFLGFSGFPEMQQAMQDSLQKQLTTTERLKMSSQVYDDKEKWLYNIFQDDLSNIRSTMENLDIKAFQKAVDQLLKAKNIYIVASRSAVSLGMFMEYYLRIMRNHVEFISSVELIPEKFYHLDEHDVVVGISFPRYTQSTLRMFSFARERGATTIAITDNLLSPMVPIADVPLTASSRLPSFIDSFVAPLSLMNALITQIGNSKQVDISQKLDHLENMWDYLDIFHRKSQD
ncbi:DNA-binding transcriptional regulator, MurR/RpiR family, contains HTH and SIS domains [Salinibacillus kushneri]|uniref:DNA-binding transcriptional regulator, MurR/RpiR family, contains HTH and SIS domains n=1 Tax=Salinibacillus kushneri TaxID=237682 RepID=A0A1I0DLU8_9BACI|nr:MurR/RpiR family transcriptional regulator [Salinibacillus kushneri]SET33333.1 DNA-binding transcriptional regulator, MurR/RpiR family, contains HTH and SIS domains [Salinibacillus kushneri]